MTSNTRSVTAVRPHVAAWPAASAHPAPASAVSARFPVATAVSASAVTGNAHPGRAEIPNPNAEHPDACPARVAFDRPAAGSVPPRPVSIARVHLGHGTHPNVPLPELHASALLVVVSAGSSSGACGNAHPLDDAHADVRVPRSVLPSAASFYAACAPYLPYTGFYGIYPVLAMHAYMRRREHEPPNEGWMGNRST